MSVPRFWTIVNRTSFFYQLAALWVLLLFFAISVFSCGPINIVDNYFLTIATDSRYNVTPAGSIPVKQYKKYAITTSLLPGLEEYFTFDSWTVVGNSHVVFDNAHKASTRVMLTNGDAIIRPVWNSSKVIFSRQDVAGILYNLKDMAVADLNQDGYDDLLCVGSMEGGIEIYINTDSSSPWPHVALNPPDSDYFTGIFRVLAADLNNDSRPDIISLKIAKNPRNTAIPNVRIVWWETPDLTSGHESAWTAINDNTVWPMHTIFQGPNEMFMDQAASNQVYCFLQAVDLDFDGYKDLLIAGKSKIGYCTNPGKGESLPEWLYTSIYADTSSISKKITALFAGADIAGKEAANIAVAFFNPSPLPGKPPGELITWRANSEWMGDIREMALSLEKECFPVCALAGDYFGVPDDPLHSPTFEFNFALATANGLTWMSSAYKLNDVQLTTDLTVTFPVTVDKDNNDVVPFYGLGLSAAAQVVGSTAGNCIFYCLNENQIGLHWQKFIVEGERGGPFMLRRARIARNANKIAGDVLEDLVGYSSAENYLHWWKYNRDSIPVMQGTAR
jgi:hypothetical protein